MRYSGVGQTNGYLDSTGNSLSANSYESYNSSSNHSYRGKAINLNANKAADQLAESNGKPLIDGTSSSTLRLEMQSPDAAALSSDQSSSWYGVYNGNGTLPSHQRMIHQEQEYEEIAI